MRKRIACAQSCRYVRHAVNELIQSESNGVTEGAFKLLVLIQNGLVVKIEIMRCVRRWRGADMCG